MPLTSRRGLAGLLTAGILAASLLLTPSASADAEDAEEGPRTWALATAGAEGPDGRGVFEYIVEPGDVYEDHLAVRNFGDQPLTVTVYAQDAVQNTENDFEVLTPDEEARRVGSWTQIDETEVTVPARENVVVPFRIVVPLDAEPGDHPGAILAVSVPDEETGPTVQYRVGTRIYLRVAGPVEAGLEVDRLNGSYEMRWSPFAPAPLDIEATLKNTGNIRVSPEARLVVSSIFGWWSQSAPLAGLSEILPGGAQSGGVRLDEVPPLGPLWVTVEIPAVASAGQDVTAFTEITSRTVIVWAVPWVLVVAAALLLLAAVIAIVNLRRRLRARSDRRRR